MIRVPAGARVWTVCLLASVAAAAVCFVALDVPIAAHFWDAGRSLAPLGQGLGSRVILSGEALVILFVVLMRLAKGHASTFGKTLVIASLASMSAYVINDQVLKVFFGVPSPQDVLQGADHVFNLLLGTDASSFPSGHMVLAGAFAGVFMRVYRASVLPLSALLILAAGLLTYGDWHFLSDIVIGGFLGISAGTLAAKVWLAHSSRA